MRQYVTLDKYYFDEFIKRLASVQKLIAPVKRGMKNFAFSEVSSAEEISLKYIPTILPPKKYFFPTKETLLEYNISKKEYKAAFEYEKMIIFGVHTCDLAGIQCLNMVFWDIPKDMNYLMRKDKIAIIGLECNEYCDEYASCWVMDNYLPNGGYDLFFTDLGNYFIVHINTLLGESIVKRSSLFKLAQDGNLKDLAKLREKKRSIFKDEVNIPHKGLKSIFDNGFKAKVWDDLDKRCLSCGNCTNVCPTCYCFNIIDDVNLDLNSGERFRVWDSCQNESFAKVTGGKSFREERGIRQMHRYMRKFKYPVEKYSRYFCTGCGRCSRQCMANINLKETINSLVEEECK